MKDCELVILKNFSKLNKKSIQLDINEDQIVIRNTEGIELKNFY